MKKNNKKFSQEVPTGSMDASIIALMQGQVDATAAYYNGPDAKTGKINDARSRVENIYPNISKETSTYGCDDLPIVITLLHTEKNTPTTYQNTGNIVNALETFQTIITFNSENSTE